MACERAPRLRALEPYDGRLVPEDERFQARRPFPVLAGAKLRAAGGGALHDVGEEPIP